MALATALIAVLPFLPAVAGPWIYDDHILIPDNPYIHSFEHWPRWFITDFWDVGGDFVRLGLRIIYWRPFVTFTYATDWKIGGGSPLFFHVMNLLWQAAVGAVAFAVLRRWIGASRPALLAAALFVVHPTKAESVAWIAGRTDVICMIAVLLASQGMARRLTGRRGGIALEVFGTLIAYMSKEQAIILPMFAVIEAWVAADRPVIDRATLIRAIRFAGPQALLAMLYLVLRKIWLPLQPPTLGHASMPISDHVQAVLESFGHFAVLTVAPHDLSIQQGLVRSAAGHAVHSLPYVIAGAVAVVALIAAAWVLRTRNPAVTLGIAFFFVTIAPTSNIIPTQMQTLVSERFLYLPLLGLTLAIGALLLRAHRALFGVVGGVCIVFAVQSALRSADYRSEDGFWARELALHPASSEARRARIRQKIHDKQYRVALRDTLELTRTANDYQDLPVAADIAQLLADLAPDHDRVTLEKIDQFCRELIERTPPAAKLDADIVHFEIPTTGAAYNRYMRTYELRLLALRATIHRRLGDDAGAIALAKTGLDKCGQCETTITSAALTFAGAGHYEEALAVLDDATTAIPAQSLTPIRDMVVKSQSERMASGSVTSPRELQALAASYATVELWGRAYDVLAPYKDEITRAPKFVMGFAELAVRAGEIDVARSVLAATTPAAEIETLIAGWLRTMGRLDDTAATAAHQ